MHTLNSTFIIMQSLRDGRQLCEEALLLPLDNLQLRCPQLLANSRIKGAAGHELLVAGHWIKTEIESFRCWDFQIKKLMSPW
jgi:hypothetical protein